MTERELRLIGLGVRAGSVVVGTSGVRDGIHKGEVLLVVLAGDHTRRTEEKVARLARGKGVRIVEGPDSVELGRRLGRKTVQTLGLLDPNLASEIGAVDRAERR
jgi:ribosomal protein L7Ae-like RNA K-turn-binding protein